MAENLQENIFFVKRINPYKEKQTIKISFRRIVRRGAPPVILSHAAVLSNKAMINFANHLWHKGFDVWMPNMRAHGKGKELSKVTPYDNGDYSFDNIVTEDWPIVHDFVSNATKQKVSIIGYSMGGMTWERYLSGVYKEKGLIFQSDDLAKQRSKKVNAFVELLTPPDLQSIDKNIKVKLKSLKIFYKGKHNFIPFANLSPENNSLSYLIKDFFYKRIIGNLTPIIFHLLPKGLINLEKAQYHELNELLTEHLSSPHTDYVNDMVSWFDNVYSSKDGNVNYERTRRIFTPTLVIAAEKDLLVPHQHALKQISLFPKDTPVKTKLVKEFSHIDIYMKEGVKKIGPIISDFIKSKISH